MLILCTSKYIRLASCVHNSTHCILLCTHIMYIIHSIMYTRVQNAFWPVWSHLSGVISQMLTDSQSKCVCVHEEGLLCTSALAVV